MHDLIPVRSIVGFLAILLCSSPSHSAQPVFFDGFDSRAVTEAVFKDTARYDFVTDSGRSALSLRLADSTRAIYLVHALPLEQYRGGIYLVSASSSAFALSTKPQRYNGVKVMLSVKRFDGTSDNPQLHWPDTLSSYGWQKSSMVVSVPDNALEAELVLGLESVSGTAYLDSVRIEKIGSTTMPPARSSTLPIPSAFGIRMRGAMIQVPIDTTAIARFGTDWKGNLLRWQMNGGSGRVDALTHPRYDSLLDREFALLDAAIPVCRRHGIRLVIDLHAMSSGLFLGGATQAVLLNAWKRIATRYKGSDVVAGYDLANEPLEDTWRPGALLWNELADTLCRTIREIDPATPIVVEPMGGDVNGFAELRPIGSDRGWDMPNIVYSFHFYLPYSLTHQGISANHPPLGAVYPGRIDGIEYDSALLRKGMQAAVDYQNRYRVPIYVGEFSCIRWAPRKSAHRWLSDVTAILESYGWDWSYHAYREYHGWSVEYSDSLPDMRSNLDTDRKALLMELYRRNTDPYATRIGPRTSSANAPIGVDIRHHDNGTLFVDKLPDGTRLEVRGLDGSLQAQISTTGPIHVSGDILFVRLFGAASSPWRKIPTWGRSAF